MEDENQIKKTTSNILSDKDKKQILIRQHNKCGNNPNNPIYNYTCILWQTNNGLLNNDCQFIKIKKQIICWPTSTGLMRAVCRDCYTNRNNKHTIDETKMDIDMIGSVYVSDSPNILNKYVGF